MMNMMVVLAAVEVILPSDPSLSQQTAAEELREYCGKMGIESGTIELRTDESLGENGYTLETVQGRLVISGSKARGVLNGAYGYLQDVCGVDWLSSWCESVPKRTSLPAVAKKEPLWSHDPVPGVCDFNADGKPDLLFGAMDGYVYYLRNPSKR